MLCYVKAYQEAEISLNYINNYQKAVTAIRRCRQNSPAFVKLTSVCTVLASVLHGQVVCLYLCVYY